jgi:hypothetical protein
MSMIGISLKSARRLVSNIVEALLSPAEQTRSNINRIGLLGTRNIALKASAMSSIRAK